MGMIWVSMEEKIHLLSRVEQVDLRLLSQVDLLKCHRRDFLAPLVLLQVSLSRLEKST